MEFEAPGRSASSRAGAQVVQETRLYEPKRADPSTRSKEEAHDHRYFPDPDLLRLELEEAWDRSPSACAA